MHPALFQSLLRRAGAAAILAGARLAGTSAADRARIDPLFRRVDVATGEYAELNKEQQELQQKHKTKQQLEQEEMRALVRRERARRAWLRRCC